MFCLIDASISKTFQLYITILWNIIILIYCDICARQKYFSTVMEVHNKRKKYVQNWISVMIWYLEIQTVIEMLWWRIVLRKCRRRTGLINCGAQACRFTVTKPKQPAFKENVPKLWEDLPPILCGPDSFGMIDLGLHLKNMHSPSCTWTYCKDYSWWPADRRHARTFCTCVRKTSLSNLKDKRHKQDHQNHFHDTVNVFSHFA